MITFARSNIPILPACSGFPIIIRIASSDVARNTAINVPNIKDAIKLLDDTLVGTGWRVIQFWRHENYAADCVISNDDEFLQVDFCTHYERNGRVVISVQELLDGKRMYKNFYIPKPQTEFTYVLVKKY